MSNISVDNFTLKAGSKLLLHDTRLVVSANQRYGLLGPNGCGKSSLLAEIAENPEIRGDFRGQILLVKQEVIASDRSVEMEVASCQPRLYELLTTEDLEPRDEDPNPDLELAQIRRILAGLGFDNTMRVKSTSEFSGGWRMRVSIAKALYSQPELLLLDEPTNHLDQSAVVWLTNYLSEWPHGLILVSHDRHFINETCLAIMYINTKKLKIHKPDKPNNIYAKFRRAEAQERAHHESEWKKWLKRVPKLRKEGHKNNAIEEIRQKEGFTEPERPYNPQITLLDPTEVRGNILNCREVTYSYPDTDRVILEKADISLDLDSRVVIVGKNGSGKSTLLKLLAGKLKLSDTDKGEIEINRQLRVGYFHQHFDEILDYKQTPVEFILSQHTGINQGQVRRELGKIGLKGQQHTLLISELSGGQKARVVMVNILFSQPHFLLLDEPTNHLDIETNDALIEALNSFKGGMLLVTHNADLILETDCVLYECDQGQIKRFPGDYYDYCEKIMDEFSDPDSNKL